MKKVVTAALPYANGDIHVGHLLEYIQADVFTRFLKLQGHDALYICASDMHGTPIEMNAKKAGVKPIKFAEKYWKQHQKDFALFDIKFDNFYKTHSEENEELALEFYKKLKKHIYIKEIDVIYCENCERSLPDRFVKGKCPHCDAEDQYGDICEKCNYILKGVDLVEPYCVTCNEKPVLKNSKHYFFKLGDYSEQLQKWIDEGDVQKEVKNWLKGWFKKGLDDWCISRDEPYFGFEIPNSEKETGKKKFFYVWMDAPIGYISSTKNLKKNYKDYWKDVHHIIGKDIAYFHYLFWPAMLMGTGYNLPKLTTHGFVTIDGQKMSKTRGTFFTARDFAEMYPAQALRFYFASHLDRKVTDVDLNFDDFVSVNNNVLMGNLGNFCFRVLTFANKHYDTIKVVNDPLTEDIKKIIKQIELDYSELNFKSAVKNILKIADMGNAYFQKKEPWKNDVPEAVGYCVNLARNLAILVKPIIPKFSEKVFSSLQEKDLQWKDIKFNWKGKVGKTEMLVEKLEVKEDFPLQMKVGKILEVKEHPDADSLYLLNVDFGMEKRQVVAGLKKYFSSEELYHQTAVFCTNLKPAKIRGEKSEAMIMVAEKKDLKLLKFDAEVGTEVKFSGLENSRKQISFESFTKLKMKVLKKKVVYDGRSLQCLGKDIIVDNEGASIR